MITDQNFTDPLTGIPVVNGQIMTTLSGDIMVNQPTGEAPGGFNLLPGTDPYVPASIGGNPGIPRGFTEVPSTGTLVVNGRTIEEP
jgi:hypothetical protein